MAAAAAGAAGGASGSAAADPAGIASKVAIKRLHADLANLQRSPNPQIKVRPSTESLLQWHFVLHSMPADTPYCSGCYHGKIVFPPEYPHAPPSILMITPSGRLEVNKRLCLSMTDFHPESWNPAWSVETILVGLLSFFVSDQESGYGSISQPEAVRRKLASESWAANQRSPEFRELFPEYSTESAAAAAGAGARAGGEEGEAAPTAEAGDALAAQASAGAGGAGDLRLPLLGEEVPSLPTATTTTTTPAAALEVADATPTAGATVAAGEFAVAPGEATGVAGARADALEEAQINAISAADRFVAAAVVAAAGTGESPSGGGGGEDQGAEVTVSEEGDPVCWICHDADSSEPLIHPCACRGSMRGVHASCVEQWVRHHRQSALDAEPPRCSVCHQQYSGYERRPGIGGFLKHVCCNFAQQLLRITLLVGLLFAYQVVASEPSSTIPLIVRIVVVALFSVVALHKVAVLSVSLPMNQMAPRHPWLRRFFTNDQRQLAMHTAEAFAAVTILGFWAACRILPLFYVLPFLILALIPLARVINGFQPSLRCLRTFAVALLICICAPLLVLWAVATLIYRNPRRVVHPLDAGPHIAIAIAVFPLCLVCASNVPAVVLWASHSALVVIGISEILCVRRWQWKVGITWWFALQLTALAAYVATTLCEFPKGFGGTRHANLVVQCASGAWLALFCALAVAVNWELLVRQFRIWQQRHGTFTLRVPAEGQGGGDGRVAPAGAGDDAPPV